MSRLCIFGFSSCAFCLACTFHDIWHFWRRERKWNLRLHSASCENYTQHNSEATITQYTVLGTASEWWFHDFTISAFMQIRYLPEAHVRNSKYTKNHDYTEGEYKIWDAEKQVIRNNVKQSERNRSTQHHESIYFIDEMLFFLFVFLSLVLPVMPQDPTTLYFVSSQSDLFPLDLLRTCSPCFCSWRPCEQFPIK